MATDVQRRAAPSTAFRFEKQTNSKVGQPPRNGRPRSYTTMITKKSTLPPVTTSFVGRSTQTVAQQAPAPLVFPDHQYGYSIPINSANTVVASPAPAPGSTRRHHIPPLSTAGLPLSASTPASTMSYASPMTGNTVYVHPRFSSTSSAFQYPYQQSYQQQQQYQTGPNTGCEPVSSASPPSQYSVAYYQSPRYDVYPASSRKRTSVAAVLHTSTGAYFAQPSPASLHRSAPAAAASLRRRGSEILNMHHASSHQNQRLRNTHAQGASSSQAQPGSKRRRLTQGAVAVSQPGTADVPNSKQAVIAAKRTGSQTSSSASSEGRTAPGDSSTAAINGAMDICIKEEEVQVDLSADTNNEHGSSAALSSNTAPRNSSAMPPPALMLETNNAAKAITEDIRAPPEISSVPFLRSRSMPLASASSVNASSLVDMHSSSMPPLHTPDTAESLSFSSEAMRQQYSSSSTSSVASSHSPLTPPMATSTPALQAPDLQKLSTSADLEKQHRLASEKRRNAIAEQMVIPSKRKASADILQSAAAGSKLSRPNSRLADRRGNIAQEKARNLTVATSTSSSQRAHRQFPVAVQTAPMQHAFTFPPAPTGLASPAISRSMQAARSSHTPRHATFTQAGLEPTSYVAAAYPYTAGIAPSYRPMYHIPPVPQYQQVYQQQLQLQQQYQPQQLPPRPSVPVTVYPSPPRQITKAEFLTAMEHIYDALPDTGAAQQHLYQVIEESRSTVLGEAKTRIEWEKKLDERLEHFKSSVSKEMLLLEKKIASVQKVDAGKGREDRIMSESPHVDIPEQQETTVRRPTSNLRGC